MPDIKVPVYPARCRCVSVVSLVILLALSTMAAGNVWSDDEVTAPARIIKIVQKAQTDAEQQIRSLHGQSAFSKLQERIAEYPLEENPEGPKNDPCPALGFISEETESDSQINAFNRGGAYFLTGIEALFGGYPQMAKWCFAVAISEVDVCAVYLSNLAFILNEEGAFGDAGILLEYAKELDAGNSSIYNNLAYSYRYLEKYDEAIQVMLMAVALHPDFQHYRDLLQELLDLGEAEKHRHLAAPGNRQQAKAARLSDALDLLEKRKDRKLNEEMAGAYQQMPASGRNDRHPYQAYRPRSGMPDKTRSTNMVYADHCGPLSKMAYVLTAAGDEWLRQAGVQPGGGNPVDKIQQTGPFDPATYIPAILYGEAADIYMQCKNSGKWNNTWPEIDRQLAEASEAQRKSLEEYLANLAKPEKYGKPVCSFRNSTCISRGSTPGSFKFEVNSVFGSHEFRIHPDINKFGLKTSTGNGIKKSLGGVAEVNVGYNYYNDCTLGLGCVEGVEVGAGLNVGKGVTTKSDIIKFSLENNPGTGTVTTKIQ